MGPGAPMIVMIRLGVIDTAMPSHASKASLSNRCSMCNKGRALASASFPKPLASKSVVEMSNVYVHVHVYASGKKQVASGKKQVASGKKQVAPVLYCTIKTA